MAKMNDVVMGMAGAGGDGVISAGEILLQSAAHEGLYCYLLRSFGPQIRGGESSCYLRVSQNPIHSRGDELNLLVLFHWKDANVFRSDWVLSDRCIILVDSIDKTFEEEIPAEFRRCKIIRVPFEDLAKEKGGGIKTKNILTLGILSELFGFPQEGLKNAIRKKFKRKDPAVAELNLKAVDVGIEYAKGMELKPDWRFEYEGGKPCLVMSGNEAVALGAIVAGCRFCAAYPITPASEIAKWLDMEMPKYGGTVIQAEDEISSIGMVVGASFGGVKAMTATSGPGFSLMTETLGLASMAELPLVIVDVQRGGPSTGLPTKTEQSDLWQAMFGTHGDAPRVVLAPCDVEDAFNTTITAFNIAEEYQMPVVILSDQYIGLRTESIAWFDPKKHEIKNRLKPKEGATDYKRFLITENGVSPMAVPGMKGVEYLAAGISHDEGGKPTSHPDVHHKMNEKRFSKFKELAKVLCYAKTYGLEQPEIGIVTWGSNKGPVRDAIDIAVAKGLNIGALVPRVIFPLNEKAFQKFFKNIKKLIVVELSYQGQFEKYLRAYYDLPVKPISYCRSGGRPLTVKEVTDVIDKEMR